MSGEIGGSSRVVTLSQQAESPSVFCGPGSRFCRALDVLGRGNRFSSFRIHDQPEQVCVPPLLKARSKSEASPGSSLSPESHNQALTRAGLTFCVTLSPQQQCKPLGLGPGFLIF